MGPLVPRAIGGVVAVALTRAGVVVVGPNGEQLLVDGRLEPLAWDWDTLRKVLAPQLLAGDRVRSTRITSGEASPSDRSRAPEVAGDLYQLLRVLPRLSLPGDATGTQARGALPQIDPNGVAVLWGRALHLSPEGLGALEGVLSAATRPRSPLDPEAQGGLVDASIWSRAHVSSWRRSTITVNGKRIAVTVHPDEQLWGVSCPVRFLEDPDFGGEAPPTISLPPRSLGGEGRRVASENEAVTVTNLPADRGGIVRKKIKRIISWLSPVDAAHMRVVGGLAKTVDPEAYPGTPGVGPGVEWAAVADVAIDDFLGESEPPPERKPPPPPPNPPPSPPPNPPPWYPPPFGDDNIEEELNPPKPPPVTPDDDDEIVDPPLDDDEIVDQDEEDEEEEGPQGRQAFADDTGATTIRRGQEGTSEPSDDVFVTTQTALGPVVSVDPRTAIRDEAARTPKEAVDCPLVTAVGAKLELSMTPLSEEGVDDQSLVTVPVATVTYPDGSQVPVRTPTGGMAGASTEDRQGLVNAVLPFAPIPVPGAVGSATQPNGAIRQVIEKVNALVNVVGSAFVGGRWSTYQGNIAVIAKNAARNVIGRHVVNPDTNATPVQPGLNVYQGVTADSATASVDRPALTTTRALRGNASATAPVVRVEKRNDQGATDASDWIDCGNGKFKVLDPGTASTPGIELRHSATSPIRAGARGLWVNTAGELQYSNLGSSAAVGGSGGNGYWTMMPDTTGPWGRAGNVQFGYSPTVTSTAQDADVSWSGPGRYGRRTRWRCAAFTSGNPETKMYAYWINPSDALPPGVTFGALGFAFRHKVRYISGSGNAVVIHFGLFDPTHDATPTTSNTGFPPNDDANATPGGAGDDEDEVAYAQRTVTADDSDYTSLTIAHADLTSVLQEGDPLRFYVAVCNNVGHTAQVELDICGFRLDLTGVVA